MYSCRLVVCSILGLEPFVGFKNSPAPVSPAFGDSNWILALQQKAIFLKKIESWKNRSGCVTFCFPLSCFGHRSLVCSAFAAMGRTEISLPSRLACLHALLPPLSSLLCLALPVGYFPSESSGCFRRSQLERKSGHDEAAQVPGASMKSLQRRDD